MYIVCYLVRWGYHLLNSLITIYHELINIGLHFIFSKVLTYHLLSQLITVDNVRCFYIHILHSLVLCQLQVVSVSILSEE